MKYSSCFSLMGSTWHREVFNTKHFHWKSPFSHPWQFSIQTTFTFKLFLNLRCNMQPIINVFILCCTDMVDSRIWSVHNQHSPCWSAETKFETSQNSRHDWNIQTLWSQKWLLPFYQPRNYFSDPLTKKKKDLKDKLKILSKYKLSLWKQTGQTRQNNIHVSNLLQ